MSDTTVEDGEEAPRKGSKMPLIIGLVLALAGGGGGFFAVSSGMIPGLGGGTSDQGAGDAAKTEEPAEPMTPLGDIAFIELEPMVISLGPEAQAAHLRFRATLEVPGPQMSDVEKILPRVQDVINSYLRALQPEDILGQGALIRIRAQLLRRIQLVAGEGRVNDLLVMEFVLN